MSIGCWSRLHWEATSDRLASHCLSRFGHISLPALSFRRVKKLDELLKSIEVHWFDAGHGSLDNEEYVVKKEKKLRSAYRVLGL